jgi:hypothetical protein
VLGAQRGGAEPEAARRAGGEVLHEHVRTRDEAVQERATAGVLRVQRQRLLVAVHPHEVRAEPVDPLVVAAREVADVRPLHLDHARAEVGELPGGVRGGDRLLQ